MKRGATDSGRKSRRLWTTLAILLLHTPSGCRSEEGDPFLREAIDLWLGCTECIEGELDAVLRFEETAIPELRDALLVGLPDTAVLVYRQSLDADFDRLRNQAIREGTNLRIAREQYVDSHTANVVARQQIRAALALHALGGAEALDALEAGLASGARGDVIETVQSLLASG